MADNPPRKVRTVKSRRPAAHRPRHRQVELRVRSVLVFDGQDIATGIVDDDPVYAVNVGVGAGIRERVAHDAKE